ncbi:CoA transferase [Candidatus Bathyarchaeota archaeon]|nr:CoA transferase [Candidatus Bathyarchaeota archaeon]
MKKILEDIRILDFTHVWFGPYCTMMLAELGAEVIKVEPPWGTIGRMGPGELHHATSTTYYALNLNKKDVAMDLKNPQVKEMIKELVKQSDVVVQNFAPGAMERLGLGYDVLKKWNPGIIYAALSGFGQTGPYSKYGSYAVIAEAISGHSYATGKYHDPDGPPITMAGALGDLGPAMYAAFAIVAALRHRDRTGEGQMIDVAQIDTMVAFNCTASVAYDLLKESPIKRRQQRPQDPNRIWGILPVKDGWIQVAGERGKAIENLKQELGVEEVSKEQIQQRISGMTRMEAFKWLAEMGFPCAPVYEAHEAMWDSHLKARGMWVEVEHKAAGRYKIPNFPVKFSETPGEVTMAAPMLGQHTREVLKGLLGKKDEELDALEKQGAIVQWKG